MNKKHIVLATFLFAGLFSSITARAVTLKKGAPHTYTVKKHDTLWHISSLFLAEPWLWPELWRSNTQILNPHLIYPGDVLAIRLVNGQPVMEIEREKQHISLSPTTRLTKKTAPISLLPWTAIAPYIAQNELIEQNTYENLPHLLGNQSGDIHFVTDDVVISRSYGRSSDQYRIIRQQSIIENLDGEVLGVQVHHVADARVIDDTLTSQWLVKVSKSNFEARRGDRLYSQDFSGSDDLVLQAASNQTGYVVGNLHQHQLLGKNNVVIVDLGSTDVVPGTVMGIYARGPDIIDGKKPRYVDEDPVVFSVFDNGSKVQQPAIKIGEIVIFKTFDKASYGIITRARELVKTGAIVAHP